MSAFPQFTAKPIAASASVAAGATATLFTAGVSGTRLDSVSMAVTTAGTSTGGVLRLMINNTTTDFTLTEIGIGATAGTPGAATTGNTPAYCVDVPVGKVIPAGYLVKATVTTNGGTVHVTAFGGDY